MKKLLLSLTTVGIIFIVGIISVKALAFDTNQHHNYIDINKDGICDNYQTNLNHHHCKNYIDENNDSYCDNCQHHHRHN